MQLSTYMRKMLRRKSPKNPDTHSYCHMVNTHESSVKVKICNNKSKEKDSKVFKQIHIYTICTPDLNNEKSSVKIEMVCNFVVQALFTHVKQSIDHDEKFNKFDQNFTRIK